MRALWIRFVCAAAAGWATMLGLVYLGGWLLGGAASWLGAEWIPTVQISLNCLELTAAGFVAGRVNRRSAMLTVLIFAATLLFRDFGDQLALNVPWLLRLTRDVMTDRRYFDSWLTTAWTQALLLGCVAAGGLLSRPREKPLSVRI